MTTQFFPKTNTYDSNDMVIDEAAKKTIDHLDYKPINTGKYLVCFKPEAFIDLINAFSNIFNARSIIDGISLSTEDSIGDQISVPLLVPPYGLIVSIN